MKFGVMGISYKELNSSMREQFAWTTSKIVAFQLELCAIIKGQVVVSTCNRFEIYFVFEDSESYLEKKRQILTLVEAVVPELMDETLSLLESLFWTYEQTDALNHLFRVTAGLESMVVGEDQILGQVKLAWEQSIELGFSGKMINKIFMEAIRFAKHSKQISNISTHTMSIPSIAMRELSRQLLNYTRPSVLVVGHGSMGKMCLTYLQELTSSQDITIYSTSRNVCTTERSEFNTQLIPYDERYASLEYMDAVVSATSSPHCIFHNELIKETCKTKIWIDLALPADIDLAIKNRASMTLIGLDEIQIIANENNRLREEAAKVINDLIPTEIEQLQQWIIASKSDGIIQSLQEQVGLSTVDAMNLIRKKIALSEKEYKYIETIVNATLQRFVKSPIQYLKQSNEEELDDAMELIRRFYL